MHAMYRRLSSVLLVALVPPAVAQTNNQNSAPAQNAMITGASEVNLAVSQLGAKAQGAGQDGLGAILAGQGSAGAALAPNSGNGSSVTTIQLGSATELSRVALKVGNQKGRLRILVQDAEGDANSGKVVSELVLDGTQPTVSASVNNITARAITVVWIPDTPGQPLTVSDVGVFAVANRLPPAVVAAAAQVPAASNSPLAINLPSAVTTAPAPTPTPAPAPVVAPTPAPAQTVTQVTQTTATVLPPQTRPLSVP